MELYYTHATFFTYLFFFIATLLFSLLINNLFLKFAHTLGIRNNDKEKIIRWGTQSKPALGGLTFYIIFLLSIASYSIFFDPKTTPIYRDKQFLGLLLASNLGFLIGLTDDSYDTKPFLKFAGQVGCAIILIISGIYIDISSSNVFNYSLTIFWVVGIMNSVNMLDNMDAIFTVVAINIILSVIILIYFQYSYFYNIHFIVLVGLLASLSGFLFFNWHPSKMYMGDTGSQFLGALLATIGIIYFWNFDRNIFQIFSNEQITKVVSTTESPVRNFIIPILVFIMPIVDTSVVVINRMARKHSPFIGGKDHTTHCLARLGLTDKQVACVFTGVSFISCLLLIIIVKYISPWKTIHTIIFSAYILLVFGIFLYLTTKKRKL